MAKSGEEHNLVTRLAGIERTMRIQLFLILVSLSCSLAALIIALVVLITT